jgi:DNA polymerase III epsilon subunit-like protein
MIAVDENLNEVARYESVICPPVQVGKKILGLTRLTANQIQDAPTFENLWPDIHGFLSSRIVVAHFAAFENRVLYKEFLRLGLEEYLPVTMCTRDLTKAILPNLEKYSLEYLTELFEISHVESHQAIGDVIPTLELLRKLNEHGEHLDRKVESLKHRMVAIPRPQEKAVEPQVRIRSASEDYSPETIMNLLRISRKTRISITGTPEIGKDAMINDFKSVGLTYDRGPIVNAMAFVVRAANKPGERKIIDARAKGIPVISEDLANEVISRLRSS